MKKIINLLSFCFVLSVVSFGQQNNIEHAKAVTPNPQVLYIGIVNQFELIAPDGEKVNRVVMDNGNVKFKKNHLDISVNTTGSKILYVLTNKRKYTLVFESKILTPEMKTTKRIPLVLVDK